MIVDSPGVGESKELDDVVYEYLPKVFAFIFVLSAANSDGIQKDTVSILTAYIIFCQLYLIWLRKSTHFVCQAFVEAKEGIVSISGNFKSLLSLLLCY